MTRVAVFVCCALLQILAAGSSAVADDEPPWQPLWPDGTPGAHGQADRDIPAVRHYPVHGDGATGCGVLVCPGGGYGALAMDHEGTQIAQWLNDRGIAAWILRYRLGSAGYHYPVQKNDVIRAVRVVRHQAESVGVDPQRIGIWGFSAGGHLVSMAVTQFEPENPDAADPVDRISSRPDFAVLCYPVISMDSELTHAGSRRNLFGPDRVGDSGLVEELSSQKRVTANTPPTFLFHTAEDTVVRVENSLVFYSALRKHGVTCEMHLYQTGRHGVGLAAKDPVLSSWPQRLEDWLKINSFLTNNR